MALRHIFGGQCWNVDEHYASLIVDDPLLQRRYGHLNFGSLLRLMEEHDFSTTIAFIPHNYGRTTERIARMFRDNSQRLSLCFHGNDHTQSEFASHNVPFLVAALGMAEDRMNLHLQTTGLDCDRVMVFPQGAFSLEAMRVLRSRNFHAAVNSIPYPMGQPTRLTVGELSQPALLRYGGFPLFLRAYSSETQRQEIAFNLFFGKPVLIVEHHDIFKDCTSLLEAVKNVNSVSPRIFWSSLGQAVCRSFLRRRAENGSIEVRAYSRSIKITNHFNQAERMSINWDNVNPNTLVFRESHPCDAQEATGTGIRVLEELPAGTSYTFRLISSELSEVPATFGFQWKAKAFIRRRLSEIRDNYLSTNRYTMSLANVLSRLASRGRRTSEDVYHSQ